MQIEVNEYNTVVNGLKQQLELGRRHFNELKERKDGVISALARESVDHEATKSALEGQKQHAKVLAEAVNCYSREMDEILKAVQGEPSNPQLLIGQTICSEIAGLRARKRKPKK